MKNYTGLHQDAQNVRNIKMLAEFYHVVLIKI